MRQFGRLICVGVFLICGLLGAHRPALADDYPARPIRILVGYAAGGVVDIIACMYAKELTTRLGQSVIVDNVASGYMQRATETALRSEPDGYTLLIGTNEMLMWPYLRDDYRFRMLTDFAPVATMAKNWTVFAINNKLPAKSFSEFIEYAKKNPGKLKYGSSGVGGVLHIVGELLKQKTGIDMVHVPYRSGSQSVTDLLAGQIDMASIGVASSRSLDPARAHVIAQTGPTRHPMLPDVPTTAELGLPEVRITPWFFLLGQKDIPKPVIARLSTEMNAISQTAAFRQQLEKIGFVAEPMTHEEFVAGLNAEATRWKAVIPTMGLRAAH